MEAALDRLIARMLAKRQEDRPPSMEGVARMLRQVLARPNQAPIEASPTVTEAGTTRPGRPEAPPPAIGNSRPARGRALTVALAAAGLATAVTVMIGIVQAPNREAMVKPVPGMLIKVGRSYVRIEE